jgi:hypothetical protein
MTAKQYAKELRKLQAKLCQLQEWIKYKGLRIVIVFEGRDAAGKGGTIKALTERVSPRVFRQVALPAPSDREKGQVFFQRYLQHFPAKGEVVIFDRSWYNRAGVEFVMGFCSKGQHGRFLHLCPKMESYLVSGGIQLGRQREIDGVNAGLAQDGVAQNRRAGDRLTADPDRKGRRLQIVNARQIQPQNGRDAPAAFASYRRHGKRLAVLERRVGHVENPRAPAGSRRRRTGCARSRRWA